MDECGGADSLRMVLAVADGVEEYKLVGMNLLGNNCLAGFIYRDIYHARYESPFIWTLFNYAEFIDLVDNYDHVNFDKITITNSDKDLHNNFITIVDGKYNIKNVHMFFDPLCNTPKHIANEVFYCRIWEYIYTKYMVRLNRMKSAGNPIIIYHDADLPDQTTPDLIDVCRRHKYPAILVTNNQSCITDVDSLIYVIHPNKSIDPLHTINEFKSVIKADMDAILYQLVRE